MWDGIFFAFYEEATPQKLLNFRQRLSYWGRNENTWYVSASKQLARKSLYLLPTYVKWLKIYS